MPEPIRILLSEPASRALLEAGTAFVIAGRAAHPDPGNRIAVHFLPVPQDLANLACGVAMGTHRAVKITTKS